jgi:hypothetical protein
MIGTNSTYVYLWSNPGSGQGQEGAGGFGRHNDPVSRLLQLEPLKRDDSATATTIQSDEA